MDSGLLDCHLNIEFKDFPVSYRISQGGIALALVLLTFSRAAFSQNAPPVVRITAGSILGLIVLVSLAVSYYVIVRYPYLSLVPSSDGDYFAKHFSMSGTWLYSLLKVLALAVTAVMIVSLLFAGIDDLPKTLVLIYMMIMLGFLAFLSFAYDPVSHPTIATFIRATLGVGVILFPLFIPAVMLGSLRCTQLLENVSDPDAVNQLE